MTISEQIKRPPLPRLNNIVVLRSFAIVAVVLFHAYSPWLSAWNWIDTPYRPIYSFILEVMLVGRMPLFVFVSGYLFSHLVNDRGKYADFLGFLNNKFQRLLVPCLVFTSIMCLCLDVNLWNAIIGDSYHLWFLKMLFWCFMTAWVLHRFVKSTLLRMLFLACAFALMIFHGPTYFGLGQYYKYFVFFYGGYLFYSYRNNLKFLFSKSSIILLTLAYIGFVGISLWRYCDFYVNDIIHNDSIVSLSRHLLRFLTILLALILADYYLKGKKEISYIFTRLNNISYGIYLIHMLFIQVTHKYLEKYLISFGNEHSILAPIIFFICIISLSIGLSLFLKKWSWSKWIIG